MKRRHRCVCHRHPKPPRPPAPHPRADRYNVGSGRLFPGPLVPGQINITLPAYFQLAFNASMELYTKYAGQLAEVWIDGGENYPPLNEALVTLQPTAVYMAGTAASNNGRLTGEPRTGVGERVAALRHCLHGRTPPHPRALPLVPGYESGFPPYPTWSTADPGSYGPGSPSASAFTPAESDTPILQQVRGRSSWRWGGHAANHALSAHLPPGRVVLEARGAGAQRGGAAGAVRVQCGRQHQPVSAGAGAASHRIPTPPPSTVAGCWA
jgi:hypothetical protein